VGLAVDAIRRLFNGEMLTVSGKLRSPEHDRDFDVQNAKLQLTGDPGTSNAPHNPDNSNFPGNLDASATPNRLRLSLNGQNILDWFREQFQKLQQARSYIRPTIPRNNTNKGIKR
jgi:hypothetical protein